MNIAWSREAIDDLARLRSYILENDASAAQRVARYILHQVEAILPDNPELVALAAWLASRKEICVEPAHIQRCNFSPIQLI